MYNTAYQVLSLLIPLITTPYASRVFGAEGVGVQSYAHSLATVFSQFAALGVAAYGQREIARNREDKAQTSKLFWEIVLLSCVTTAISMVVWIIVSLVEKTYTPYLLLSGFTVLAVAFDITWFFAGLEEFKFVALRNAAVKLAGVALLFLVVRSRDDLLLYVALLSASGLAGNLSMWLQLRRYLQKVPFSQLQIFRHLKQTVIYFIPTIAATVYTVVDKAMLRFLTEGTEEIGYYEQTTKIVRMAQVVLLSINTVMSARMSYLFSVGKLEELKRKLEKSVSFILLMAVPFTLGIIGVARNFVPWFFGEGFEPVVPLLCVYSPLLLVVGISNCLGTQYLTPSGQRGRSSKGILLGAGVNVILNLLVIPVWGAAGAAVASVMAELIIMIVYAYMSREYLSIRTIWKHSGKRLVAGGVMLLAVLALDRLPFAGVWMTVAQVALGAAVYVLMLLLLRDNLLMEVLRKALAHIEKHKKFY